MEILKILALVCLAVAGAAVSIAKLDPSNRKKAPRTLRLSEAGNKYEEEDRRFEAKLFGSLGPGIVKHFYTKVVGITQENENGRVRETLLSRCKQFDFLQLVTERSNSVDSNAIAVCLKDGTRLGYLNSRTAEGIARDLAEGVVWLACVKFRKLPKRPRNGCLVLCMIKRTDSFVGAHGAKRMSHLGVSKMSNTV